MNCLNCKEEFEAKDYRQKFCSQSCAATYNNSKRVDQIKKICPQCENEFFVPPYNRAKKFCGRECYLLSEDIKFQKALETKTLANVKKLTSFQTGQWAYVHDNAKRVLSKTDWKWECKNCGYDKHVEVCHVRSIKEFDLTATLAEVNSLDNLMLLCPNCHWEFDHGIT
jgi:5-methylcytosine-specific restriction endonuclease McrA